MAYCVASSDLNVKCLKSKVFAVFDAHSIASELISIPVNLIPLDAALLTQLRPNPPTPQKRSQIELIGKVVTHSLAVL